MHETESPGTLISVIVPTRNNIATIGATIESVLAQSTGASLELLVVDGQSADGTAELAARMGAVVYSYPCTGDMRGYARNLGARKSHGRFLLFLDSDMRLPTGVIQECVDKISQGFDALIIPETNIGMGLVGNLRAWERNLVQQYDYLSVARFMSRLAFFKTGGFDERIIGFEDLDLQATLIEKDLRIGRTEIPLVHDERGIGLRSYIRKRMYYERTARYYRSKHPEISKIVFSPIDRMRIYVQGLRHINELPLLTIAMALRAFELTPLSRKPKSGS
jgi:glycosyltransferase involved in cell wall biosynthesis